METTVSLVQMLDARERRVQHQQELLAQYHKPLICFTMNICGPIKDSPLIRRGFARGRQLLRQQFLRAKLTPLYQDAVREVTGCEAFYVLDADPLTIKKFTTDIEDATPLGRLFDMDVIRPDGLKVDREELNLEGRRCLICGGPAKVCSSRRIHTVAKLQEKTTEILTEARDAQDIADAARLAVRALLYEVTTTPKPGLVDRRNSGSHKDMDVFTFMDSAAALYPYFEACAQTGRETAEQPAPETFAALRPLGCEAEGEMLDATGGVNTHKGAVFSVGIVCAALGRLDRSLWAEAARVLAEVSAMTAGLTEKDFAGVTAENAATVGQKLYIQYGITGVRGQVEAGLPTVLNVGLPVLEEGLAKGYDFDRAGGGALLAILANSTDTNIIARSSRERQLALTEELKALLAQTPYPDKDALAALDDRFIAENLSPGGSADLLALTKDGESIVPACTCTDKCAVGKINTGCKVCRTNMSECAGKEAEPEPEETEQPPEEEKGGDMGGAILLVVLLLAAAGGGAFYYFKIMKPKKDAAKGSSNLDDLDFDEDDEEELETEQEDEEV